jgi:hypothetical protein
MGKIVKLSRCWSDEWTNKYGKADIKHLLENRKIEKGDNVIQMKFLEEEEYREIFYEWKRSIRNKRKIWDRFNNDIDKIERPIGINILKYPLVKRKFEEWMRKEKYISKIV